MSTSPAEKRFWTRTKVSVSVLAGLIGVLGSGLTIYQVLSSDPSNFTHLQIEAAPLATGASEWALPPEALNDTFPVPDEGSANCGDEQLAWLKANAVELTRQFQLDMRNTAAEGPELTLMEFRTTAVPPEERGQPQIRIVCESSDQMPETIHYARFDTDHPEAVARNVTLSRGDGERNPDIPVLYSLAPGESQNTLFELFSRYPAEGNISVTVLSGEEERDIEVEGSAFSVPPLLFSGEMYLLTRADGLRCERLDGGSIQDCTLADVQREAATAEQ